MANIKLLSERKGSNPGGVCSYKNGKKEFKGYIKYCPGTRLPRDCVFTSQNQPVYEALTAELARSIGLRLPKSYVLLNNPLNEFETEEASRQNIWDSHRKSYFLSELVSCDEKEDLLAAQIEMEDQKIFRELLMISDIEGRKQNWFYCPEHGGLNYLDVGCGIVQAHEGVITMKHEAIRHMQASEKDLKKVRKELSRYNLISANNEEIFNVKKILESPYTLSLPILNPQGQKTLTSLISEAEIDMFVKILTLNVGKKIKHFGNCSRLIIE